MKPANHIREGADREGVDVVTAFNQGVGYRAMAYHTASFTVHVRTLRTTRGHATALEALFELLELSCSDLSTFMEREDRQRRY